MNHGLFFRRKYSLQLHFLKKIITFEDFILVFKIGNNRVVENIFPEKHEL